MLGREVSHVSSESVTESLRITGRTVSPTRPRSCGSGTWSACCGWAGKLGPGRARAVVDEDDVVADALGEIFRAMEAGQFAKLDDRHDLWQVLVILTERRVINDQIRHKRTIKRGAAKADSPGAGGRGCYRVLAVERARQYQSGYGWRADSGLCGRELPSSCRSCWRHCPTRQCGTLRPKNSRALYESRDCGSTCTAVCGA